MSFTTAYQAAAALAVEYTNVNDKLGALACASDHDRDWGPADDDKLNAMYARQAELAKKLAAAFAVLERDHHDAWHVFLVESTERLGALSRHGESGRIAAEYEHDQWSSWSRGTLEATDQPEIFARGVATLAEHRDTIDDLMRRQPARR